jgi:hypothetical protein
MSSAGFTSLILEVAKSEESMAPVLGANLMAREERVNAREYCNEIWLTFVELTRRL